MLGLVWKIFEAFLVLPVGRKSEDRVRWRTGRQSTADTLVRTYGFDTRRLANAPSRFGSSLRFKRWETFCPEVSPDSFTPPQRIPKASWDVLMSQAVFRHDHRGRENDPDPSVDLGTIAFLNVASRTTKGRSSLGPDFQRQVLVKFRPCTRKNRPIVGLETWPESQHSQGRRFLGVESRWYGDYHAVYRLKLCRIRLEYVCLA